MLQIEKLFFTKKWREACKLPVKVTIFPKNPKRDNPTAVLFRRSLCREELHWIDFSKKCAPLRFSSSPFRHLSATKRVQTRALGPKLWGSGPLLPRTIFKPLPASPGSKILIFPGFPGRKLRKKCFGAPPSCVLRLCLGVC